MFTGMPLQLESLFILATAQIWKDGKKKRRIKVIYTFINNYENESDDLTFPCDGERKLRAEPKSEIFGPWAGMRL